LEGHGLVTDRRSFLLGLGALVAGAVAGVKKAMPAGWVPITNKPPITFDDPSQIGSDIFWHYDPHSARWWSYDGATGEWTLEGEDFVSSLIGRDERASLLDQLRSEVSDTPIFSGSIGEWRGIEFYEDDPGEVLEHQGDRPRSRDGDAPRPLQQRREVGIQGRSSPALPGDASP
jgi:hypothetical protein